GAPVVGVHAGDLVSEIILGGNRQVGRGKLLAELRRKGIEFSGKVIRDHAGELRGDVRRGVDVELDAHAHLVCQRNLLAYAERHGYSGKRSNFHNLREETQVVGHHALLTHAGPNRILVAGETWEGQLLAGP